MPTKISIEKTVETHEIRTPCLIIRITHQWLPKKNELLLIYKSKHSNFSKQSIDKIKLVYFPIISKYVFSHLNAL